jgi:hypothetical protein
VEPRLRPSLTDRRRWCSPTEKNGYGAINSITNTLNPAPASPDELANTNGTADLIYVSHGQSDVGSTAGEFDDNVVWLSREILLNRMVAGGRLP